MADIKIEYDGEYPGLCFGHLVVTVDGVVWDFGYHNLRSGGSVWFDEDWNENVEIGEWDIKNWRRKKTPKEERWGNFIK